MIMTMMTVVKMPMTATTVLRMYFWWNFCALYLLTSKVTDTFVVSFCCTCGLLISSENDDDNSFLLYVPVFLIIRIQPY